MLKETLVIQEELAHKAQKVAMEIKDQKENPVKSELTVQ